MRRVIGREQPTRRRLLCVLSGIAVEAASPGLARSETPQKMSQADAEYRAAPKDGFACGLCSLFRPPRGCVIVAGDISPAGWCKFFDLAD
jgi:hypothetical protein